MKIKYILSYIWNLIKLNPAKSIFFIILIVSSCFIEKFPRTEESGRVIGSGKDEIKNKYVYIKMSENGGNHIYTLETFDEEKKIDENGYIQYTSYNELNIVFWILSIISLIVIILSSVIEGFDRENCCHNSLLSFVKCELENGKYYYICMGRLIGTFDRQLRYYDILHDCNIYSFKRLKVCPKFDTKTNKRNDKLEKLGI